MEFPKLTTGSIDIVPITDPEELERDKCFTNPNLHRRYQVVEPADPKEVSPRTHLIYRDSINSYRSESIYYHDEESTTCEIP